MTVTEQIIEAVRTSRKPFATVPLSKELKLNFGSVNGIVSRLYTGKLVVPARRERLGKASRLTTFWKPAFRFTMAEGQKAIRKYEDKANQRRRERKQAQQHDRLQERVRPAAKHHRVESATQLQHEVNMELVLMLLKRIRPELDAIVKALGA